MTALRFALLAADAVAGVLALVRWLRVAQREHYLTGAVSRFAARWWGGSPFAVALTALAAVGAVLTFLPGALAVGGFVTACAVAVGPPGLGIRGRTSALSWTRRLRVLGAVAAMFLVAAVVVAGAVADLRWATAAAAVADPRGPARSRYRLGSTVSPRSAHRAALCGDRPHATCSSYPPRGRDHRLVWKDDDEGVRGACPVRALQCCREPRSFNNQAGLARTVNELLVPGTDVLIAEMGAYGPGEIAALCRWLPPDVAVITAIGPVHLERFKTLERTLAAKSEITATARHVVLNVDDPRLAGLADELAARRGGRWSGARVATRMPTLPC